MINLDFSREDRSVKQWAYHEGIYLIEASSTEYVFVEDKVPSDISYELSDRHGTIDSEMTIWNGISCPDPPKSQIFFNGTAASIKIPEFELPET